MKKRSSKIIVAIAIIFASIFSFVRVNDASAVADSNYDADAGRRQLDVNTCLEIGGATSWISCPLVDSLENIVTNLFRTVIEDWLKIKPELLSTKGSNPGMHVKNAWNVAIKYTNLLLIIYLIVIILSQVSGIGISNYGIKKALPRVVVCAILANLSYFICQAAIDLGNILGQGIGGLFEGFMDNAALNIVNDRSGLVDAGIVSMVVAIIGVIVALMIASPAFIMPALTSLFTAALGVIFLFIALGVRQALAIMLTIVSPLAILAYSIPGTKSLYNKWFNLMKGVIIAYPMASLLIYGGALVAKILYVVWGGPSSFFGSIGALIITFAPYFALPSLIFKSVSTFNNLLNKAQSGIAGWGSKKLNQTGLAKNLQERDREKRIMRWSGMRMDKNGNLTQRRFSNSRNAARYRGQALGIAAATRDRNNVLSNPEIMQQRERMAKLGEEESRISKLHMTDDEIAAEMKDPNANLSEDRVAAYARRLSGSSSGLEQLHDIMKNTPGYKEANSSNARAIAEAFSNDEIETLTRQDPFLGQQFADIKSNPNGFGDFSAVKIREDTIQRLGAEDIGNISLANIEAIKNQFGPSEMGNSAATAFAQLAEDAVSNSDAMANCSIAVQDQLKKYVAAREQAVANMVSSSAGMNAQTLYQQGAASGDTIKMQAAERMVQQNTSLTPDAASAAIEGMRRSVLDPAFQSANGMDAAKRSAVNAYMGYSSRRQQA